MKRLLSSVLLLLFILLPCGCAFSDSNRVETLKGWMFQYNEGTAKRFERRVAHAIGACEETWSMPPISAQNAEKRSRSMCKYFMTVTKEKWEKIIGKSSLSPSGR